MEVMVIYVWQCMVVVLYDCICARWLWSIMNEHATATINSKGCSYINDRCRGTRAKVQKEEKEEREKEERKSVHGRIRTCDLLLVKPTLLTTVLLLMC